MLHEQGEITQTVACNLLHEKDGIKQTMCLNARSLLGRFYPFTKMNGKVFRASRCTLRESKRDWTNVAYNVLHKQGEITQTVACNLLHEKDGIKQTTCLNERSLLEHFYPYTQFNGKVFRASRCTLRESKTQFNQRRVQRAVRTRQNHPDNVACNLLHEKTELNKQCA